VVVFCFLGAVSFVEFLTQSLVFVDEVVIDFIHTVEFVLRLLIGFEQSSLLELQVLEVELDEVHGGYIVDDLQLVLFIEFADLAGFLVVVRVGMLLKHFGLLLQGRLDAQKLL